MRLNRVLLLAASFSILIFAMVFTISCSGDDGKNGKDGKGCTVEEDGKDYKILCGGEEMGVLKQGPKGDPGSATDKGDKGDQGPKGDKGDQGEQGPKGDSAPGAVENLCVLGPQNGSSFDIICGSETIHPGSGSGGTLSGCTTAQADKYNPYELAIKCSGSDTIYVCYGQVFSKKSKVCHNGVDRTQYTGRAEVIAYNEKDGGELVDLYSGENLVFKCSEVPYDPNKQFCTGTELVDLCGASDYQETNDFCFTSNSGYKILLNKCGTPDKKTFTKTQFCPVQITYNTSTKELTKSRYTTATTAIPTLCGGLQYDGDIEKVKDVAYLEIGPVSLTGGEYYASSMPAGYKVALNKGSSSATQAYIYGSSICQNNVVMTKCSKTTGDTLLFNDKTQFCRDKNSDSLEIVALCLKTGETKGGQTYSKDYICDPSTGIPSKSCSGSLYDEDKFFCYGNSATGTKGKKCKDDGTQYDPAVAFCGYGSKGGLLYEVDSIALETSRNKCGGAEYNVGEFSWEYCVTTGSGQTAVQSVLFCGENEEPTSGTSATCKCLADVAKNPWTNKCIKTTDCPTDATTCGAGETATCPAIKPRYDATSNACLACTGETPNYNSATNTCVAACSSTSLWFGATNSSVTKPGTNTCIDKCPSGNSFTSATNATCITCSSVNSISGLCED